MNVKTLRLILVKKIKLFFERFREAWLACAAFMVQGDLTVFNLNHAMIAAKTGSIAGLAFVVVSFSKRYSGQKWATTWLMGVITAIADYITHDTHFGPSLAEALCTGLGAALLAYLAMLWKESKSNGKN